MMDLGATHSWTLSGIVGSFFDLVVAYFLLCGSALVFFGSKVCILFGLYMPCPCSGIFGYQNGDLCLHKLFVEWPLTIICYVQMRAKSRFPFNYVLAKDQTSNLNVNLNGDGKRGKGVIEVEGDGEGGFSGMVSRNWGKRSVNQKQRSGVRRRRRVSLEYGRFSPVVSSGSSRSVGSLGAGVPIFPFSGNDMKNEIKQSLSPVDGVEDNLQGYGVSPTSIDMSEISWYSFQRSLSFEESKDGDASSVGKCETKTDKPEIFGSEAKTITMLKQALEEERAASAALQLELEKERAAAASATDEAMAMILRLQKEKASLEMEAMQYQRLIEEKFAHDEDEMSVLKDILIRRERENHFLEKELEAYREMNSSRDEQFEDDLKTDTLEAPQNGVVIEKTYSCDGEELKKDGEHGEQVRRNLYSSLIAVEPTVHDVHVIDDKIELHEENENCYEPVTFAASDEPENDAPSFEALDVHSRELDISGESESDYSSNKTSLYGFRKSLLSAVDTDRVELDTEVERLREMLRIVQDGKEKLSVLVEKSERENTQLELLEEMVNQFQEVQHLQEPLRQASLPPPSSKHLKFSILELEHGSN